MFGAIIGTLLILSIVGFFGWLFFVHQPKLQDLRVIRENKQFMEEKERLLDREILRNIYANQQNEDRILENQLIKKMYSYMRAQSLDKDDGLLVKPIAEKILKVIGKY